MNPNKSFSSHLFAYLNRLGLLLVFVVGLVRFAHAGGGGENLLLVVNPNDEPSLRIANAYIALRHIPANNVLYLVPPLAPGGGATALDISESQFNSGYVTPIYNAIAARGLINQIDYIGTLGQTQVVTAGTHFAITDCLSQLTQLHNGIHVSDLENRRSELFQGPDIFTSYNFNYTTGSNFAIHHSQVWTILTGTSPTPTVQWYMGGMIAYTGQFGMPPEQVIKNLQRTVAADGTKPQGTIYFEDSGDDARSGSRKIYWPTVQNYMTVHGIPWTQEASQLPVNHQDVMGAQCGYVGYIVPQSSKYLPGSWSDNFTSWSEIYYTDPGPLENPNGKFIQAGCAATGGTVMEPMSNPGRFSMPEIYVFQHDGSTLGEAFYKTMLTPDLNLFHGDLLSQAFADIPQVTFTSAPGDGSMVTGILSLSASASLSNPITATGIASLSLFVDGLNTGMSVSGSAGTFNLDTITLTDGMHELRVVAYNNSQAASEGCAILNLAVNNLGQSVGIAGTNSYTLAWNQTLPLTVTATPGTGPGITGIQLQCNGRVLGSMAGTSGTISLSGSQLACHGNPIAPVALLSNGKQVQGTSITVNCHPKLFQGTAQTQVINRNPGFDYYYYPGAAGNTLATTNFTGTASSIGHSNFASINHYNWDVNLPSSLSGANSAGYAVAIKGSFTVTTPGEYSFFGLLTGWTSAAILVDGGVIRSYDTWNGSSFVMPTGGVNPHPYDTGATVYLLPGEHTVTFQLVEKSAMGAPGAIFYFSTERPGVPNTFMKAGQPYDPGMGVSNFAGAPMFYTVQKTNVH